MATTAADAAAHHHLSDRPPNQVRPDLLSAASEKGGSQSHAES
jgi:hypothetical protein